MQWISRQQVGLDMTAAEDAQILSESMAVSLNAQLAEVAGGGRPVARREELHQAIFRRVLGADDVR